MVRYVDQELAIIELHVSLTTWAQPPEMPLRELQVLLEVRGSDGFFDEQYLPLRLGPSQTGMVRYEMVHPQRWWPAGMGEQVLYELTITLLRDELVFDHHSAMVGLTSVRLAQDDAPTTLLVNGQRVEIASIVAVDQVDESRMLPATGSSLLVVRDHYGTDVLYDAADRAGILMVQCVPIHPEARPEHEVRAEVQRLAGHPSLAGWYVGHLGRISDTVATYLRDLDPTRAVFREMPGAA